MGHKLTNSTMMVCILTLLTGCASSSNAFMDWFTSPEEVQKSDKNEDASVRLTQQPDSGIRYRAESRDQITRQVAEQNQPTSILRRAPNSYQPVFSHKSLSDYAEQLTMELVKNGRQLNTQSKVGVASFVNLDATLTRTSAVGNQLSELLIAEVQGFGVQVVDFKTTNNIAVGQNGDLVFSRDANRLTRQLGLDYVLSGTLITNDKGVRVNARIVDMGSKIVVSSASILIPHFVVESVQPYYVQVSR